MAEGFGITCHELVSLDFRCGSRLCENAGAETFRAIIESGRCRRRIIIATEANLMNEYFVSVAEKWFSHSLGHNRKSSVGLGMSVVGGKADFDFGWLDVCL